MSMPRLHITSQIFFCLASSYCTPYTLGESIAIVLALVGAEPVKEGTGRVVRFDLIPLDELKRPRIDILASLSGIFR